MIFKHGACSAPCGLVKGQWQNLDIWRCKKCGFETFDEPEAIAHLTRS